MRATFRHKRIANLPGPPDVRDILGQFYLSVTGRLRCHKIIYAHRKIIDRKFAGDFGIGFAILVRNINASNFQCENILFNYPISCGNTSRDFVQFRNHAFDYEKFISQIRHQSLFHFINRYSSRSHFQCLNVILQHYTLKPPTFDYNNTFFYPNTTVTERISIYLFKHSSKQ